MLKILDENLLHNVNEIRNAIKSKTKLYAVVKANAYGLGINNIVPIIDNVVDGYVVFNVQESIEVRRISTKNIIMLGTYQIQDLENIANQNIEIIIHDKQELSLFKNINKEFNVHLELDSGLGRHGMFLDEIQEVLELLKSYKSIKIVGLMSHFADAKNITHTNLQVSNFNKACDLLKKYNYENILKSISASSGLSNTNLNFGAVRVGASIFGINQNHNLNIQPVIRWTSNVSQIRTLPADSYVGYNLTYKTAKITKTAVIPVGYADGFDRRLSNTGEVLIHGVRCRVLGVVMMNNIVVDVSDLKRVSIGDEVVLLGKQDQEEITLSEIAQKCGTIEYDILCNLNTAP